MTEIQSEAHLTIIEFDAQKHKYSIYGIVRPSVTQIIGASGLINTEWYSQEAMVRGTAVHMACHYLDEKDLGGSWIERSPYAGYVRSWVLFKTETNFRPQLIEHRVWHPGLNYCGMLDRTGLIHDNSLVLVDLKTGGPEPWHRLQTVAYAAAFDKPRSFRRMTVHLQKDGSRPYINEHPVRDYADDWNTFQACKVIFDFTGGKNVRTRNLTGTAA